MTAIVAGSESQPHTTFRIRPVEPWISESRRQCDLKGLLERFGRQVNVTPKLGEVLGVLFAARLVGVARHDGATLSLFDVVVKVFDKRVRVLLILKPSFERRVEHQYADH